MTKEKEVSFFSKRPGKMFAVMLTVQLYNFLHAVERCHSIIERHLLSYKWRKSVIVVDLSTAGAETNEDQL